jgi:CheY-like chemotaxis protein
MQSIDTEPRVLFIDDSSINLKLAEVQFRQLGIRCSLSLNAKDALQLIKMHSFCAILTDIVMPGMDGMELARQVRKLEMGSTQRIPVIAVTSSVEDEDKEKYKACGMDDVLEKPVSVESLSSIIRKWTTIDLSPSTQTKNPSSAVKSESPINFQQLAALLGDDDQGTLLEWVSLFRELFPDLLENIASAIQKRDAKSVQAAAHKAKGSANSTAAIRLAKLLGDLEKDAGLEKWLEFGGQLKVIEAEFSRI